MKTRIGGLTMRLEEFLQKYDICGGHVEVYEYNELGNEHFRGKIKSMTLAGFIQLSSRQRFDARMKVWIDDSINLELCVDTSTIIPSEDQVVFNRDQGFLLPSIFSTYFFTPKGVALTDKPALQELLTIE